MLFSMTRKLFSQLSTILFVAFYGVVLNMILANLGKSCVRLSRIRLSFILQEVNHGSIVDCPNTLFPVPFTSIRDRQGGKE